MLYVKAERNSGMEVLRFLQPNLLHKFTFFSLCDERNETMQHLYLDISYKMVDKNRIS